VSTSILEQLGVIVLAILFSLLFTTRNNIKARNEKARLNGMKK